MDSIVGRLKVEESVHNFKVEESVQSPYMSQQLTAQGYRVSVQSRNLVRNGFDQVRSSMTGTLRPGGEQLGLRRKGEPTLCLQVDPKGAVVGLGNRVTVRKL